MVGLQSIVPAAAPHSCPSFLPLARRVGEEWFQTAAAAGWAEEAVVVRECAGVRSAVRMVGNSLVDVDLATGLLNALRLSVGEGLDVAVHGVLRAPTTH